MKNKNDNITLFVPRFIAEKFLKWLEDEYKAREQELITLKNRLDSVKDQMKEE